MVSNEPSKKKPRHYKMILLLTGTPGTGKSTVAKKLAAELGYELISINKWLSEQGKEAVIDYDSINETKIVDLEIIEDKFKDLEGNVIIEGHLSHFLDAGDIVIVLRAHPNALRERLASFPEAKMEENLEAEALDVCLIESLERYEENRVFEVDTTDKHPEAVSNEILRIIQGKGGENKPGKIDWSEELQP